MTNAVAVSAEARDAGAFNSLAEQLSAWTETPPAPKPETAKDAGAGDDVPSHSETTEAASAEAEPAPAGEAEDAGAEPESEPEASAEETPAEPEPEGWSPEQQAAFNKRVGKEVAKRKALEEELNSLKAQVQAKPEAPAESAPAVPPAEPGGLAEVKTEAELGKLSNLASRVLDAVDGQIAELQDNPENVEAWLKERGVTEAELGGEFTVGKMHKHLLRERTKADRILRDAPKRQDYLRAEAANRQQVQADPEVNWVLNPNDPRQAHVKTVYQLFPALRAYPDHLELAATVTDALLKRQKAKAGAPVAKAPAPKLPPKPPGRTSAAPPKPAPAQLNGSAAESRFRKSRDIASLAEVLA